MITILLKEDLYTLSEEYLIKESNHNFILIKNSYIYSHLEEFNIDVNKIKTLEKNKPYETFYTYKEITNRNISNFYDEKNLKLNEKIINSQTNNAHFEFLVLFGKYKNYNNNFFSKIKNYLNSSCLS